MVSSSAIFAEIPRNSHANSLNGRYLQTNVEKRAAGERKYGETKNYKNGKKVDHFLVLCHDSLGTRERGDPGDTPNKQSLMIQSQRDTLRNAGGHK